MIYLTSLYNTAFFRKEKGLYKTNFQKSQLTFWKTCYGHNAVYAIIIVYKYIRY